MVRMMVMGVESNVAWDRHVRQDGFEQTDQCA